MAFSIHWLDNEKKRIDMKKDLIILGTAHLDTTPGKCSPDGKFREAVWSREFVGDLKPMLESYGLDVMIDWPDFNMVK